MAALEICLLGRPRVLRHGALVEGRVGHKAWGLLLYLVQSRVPMAREALASLLCAEADDPLGALRWNLSSLRRLLGSEVGLGGDPVQLSLPADTVIDVRTVSSGSWQEALRVPDLGRPLLAGTTFTTCPSFERWLDLERRHLDNTAEGVLREAALTRLAARQFREAAGLAERLVRMNPLVEEHQSLLVRCLAAAGDGMGAARQVGRCTELFRRELGLDPSPALAQAARARTAMPISGPVSGRAAARAQLEAGQTAMAAGAIDAGLDCLRRAVQEAAGTGDRELQARALLALGSGLVHGLRGHDEEGASVLHQALELAGLADATREAGAAARELGHVEFLRGRYETARAWGLRALELAADDGERAAARCLLGSILSDVARYALALTELEAAVALAQGHGDGKRAAYALSMVGRAQLLCGDLGSAALALDRSIETARGEGWTSFLPWAEALRADVLLAEGDVAAAADRYDYAFALGCQVGDPCWEGVSARGLGLVAAARGQVTLAVDWLSDAHARATRLPDGYLWVAGCCLESLAGVGVEHSLPGAPAWTDELLELAGRTGMRDLAARAYVHRARLGDAAALDVARALAGDVDSPALARRVT